MTHKAGTREDWLAARLELLNAEKALTRRGDELARQRQDLPWVRIDKTYRFDTDEGSATLADLFRGRSQLLIYHFMFGPDYTAGCPACSAIADGFNGFAVHLANHDVMLWAVSRAPIAKLQTYRQRMGWSFPWASSFGGDFNPDFNVFFTEQQQREGDIEYNYRREEPIEPGGGEKHEADIASRTTPDGATLFADMSGTDKATYTRERPGISAFALEDGVVYHTYSAYARGLDGLWGMYQWLDGRRRGATRRACGFVAATSTNRESPHDVQFAVRDQCNCHDRLGSSMAAMGGMPMPGWLDDVVGMDADVASIGIGPCSENPGARPDGGGAGGGWWSAAVGGLPRRSQIRQPGGIRIRIGGSPLVT